MDLNVFLLSGGTRVPMHVGAVTGLLDSGVRVNAWAGVSAGSLVAAVFASGYTKSDAYQLMLETDYRRFLDLNPVSSVKGMGLYSGRKFERWLNGYLEGRTFRDLSVPLSVVTTDVATGAPFIFSNERTPDVTLARAVRCSISLPGIFATPRVDGRSLLDGCFAAVRPQMIFPDSKARSVVVSLEEGPRTIRRPGRPSPRRMLFNMVELILSNLRGLHHPELWDHQLRIPAENTSGLKFRMTHDEKCDLFSRGYEAAYTRITEVILETIEQEVSAHPLFDSSVLADDLGETAPTFELATTASRHPSAAGDIRPA